jgi:hypothetical protein
MEAAKSENKMCGIVGAVAKRMCSYPAEGLSRLEYRGYTGRIGGA